MQAVTNGGNPGPALRDVAGACDLASKGLPLSEAGLLFHAMLSRRRVTIDTALP